MAPQIVPDLTLVGSSSGTKSLAWWSEINFELEFLALLSIALLLFAFQQPRRQKSVVLPERTDSGCAFRASQDRGDWAGVVRAARAMQWPQSTSSTLPQLVSGLARGGMPERELAHAVCTFIKKYGPTDADMEASMQVCLMRDLPLVCAAIFAKVATPTMSCRQVALALSSADDRSLVSLENFSDASRRFWAAVMRGCWSDAHMHFENLEASAQIRRGPAFCLARHISGRVAETIDLLVRSPAGTIGESAAAKVLMAGCTDRVHLVAAFQLLQHHGVSCSPEMQLALAQEAPEEILQALIDRVDVCPEAASVAAARCSAADYHESAVRFFEASLKGGSPALRRCAGAWLSVLKAGRKDLLVSAVAKHRLTAHFATVILSSELQDVDFACAMDVLCKHGASSKCMVSAGISSRLLEACASRKDVESAWKWLPSAKRCGTVSASCYTNLIRTAARSGHPSRAQDLLKQMGADGFSPSSALFNEVVSASGDSGGNVLDFIQSGVAGVKPDKFTAAGVLKGLTANATKSEVEKTLQLLDDISIDEVVLCSLAEAALRVPRGDLVISRLSALEALGRIPSTVRCDTAGWVIRACGKCGDVIAVRRWWDRLVQQQIDISDISLGCMVEALAVNGCVGEALALVRDPAVPVKPNAIVYGSILKAYTRAQNMRMVEEVHAEMENKGIRLTASTYNVMIDCAARTGQMEVAAKFLSRMRQQDVDRDIVTYNIIIKGFCHAGQVSKALAVFDEVRDLADDRAYNILLDGCSRALGTIEGALDVGIGLLRDMRSRQIRPTQVTLSVGVKLFSRARQLEEAFSFVEEMSRQHSVPANVHVFNNLLQACVCNKRPQRIWEVVHTMQSQRCDLDARSYYWILAGSSALDVLKICRSMLGLKNGHAALPQAVRTLDEAVWEQALKSAGRGMSKEIAVLKDHARRAGIQAQRR
mmetsp:Transcript_18253/g.40363  ORF Transcript_18253/g.40363 Transcript_18253/m.40363 type:complete len:937 (+) Transcript_18253:121-2931(+)|eukprot:CAMPEP_0204272516 /NCGR_PEP_ID=MMETSP0468-20130131/22121_1 /ASSEMBLY_ACC=CAM_ASM_000383 /TAXON_ID=2969 /ORGANISM="Oxyrrhis marina" /LENGTH=936 /DNA_ID=CAMNT_0051248369 /DNA_START=107 /DNA_END=2917 /DNA_ORIENTATION=-